MENLQNMLSDLLGEPVFANVSPRYEVTVFNRETGEQEYFHEFDCQEDADHYARCITRDHPWTARFTASDMLTVVLYEEGCVSACFEEVRA